MMLFEAPYSIGMGPTGPTGPTGSTGSCPCSSAGWSTTSETWSYASSTTVTLVGDYTATYWPMMKVELVQGTTKYFIITSVVYSAPNTTITLWSNNIYTVANSAITSHSVSMMDSPEDFPDFRRLGFLEVLNNSIHLIGYGSGLSLYASRANGTETSPSQVLANQQLLSLSGRGYGSTGFSSSGRASILLYSAEDWTDVAQGSYIYFKTTPVGSITPTERMRIADNGYVGIGTSSPAYGLEVVNSYGIAITSYSGGAGGGIDANFIARNSRGTIGSPSALKLGDSLLKLQGRGYGATAFSNTSRGKIAFLAAEDFTDASQGTDIAFYTTPLGASASAEVVRIDHAGKVGIGTVVPTSPLQVVGLPAYANNAAAVAGGLTAGAFYRTGGDPDLVCVVH
jgi:hypothetical protein